MSMKSRAFRLYLFGFIPLHGERGAIYGCGEYYDFQWWDAFQSYRRYIQILILCGVITLRPRCVCRED